MKTRKTQIVSMLAAGAASLVTLGAADATAQSKSAPYFVPPTPSGVVQAEIFEPVKIGMAAADDDGDQVTYDVPAMPEGATRQGNVIIWTPGFADVGANRLVLRASDGYFSVTTALVINVGFEDADGEGLPDVWETQYGLSTETMDSDSDLISDFDETLVFVGPPMNTDGDSMVDALDLDSDDDGIPDSLEAGDDDLMTPPFDTDLDGIPDFQDWDSDGDGAEDALDNCAYIVNSDQLDADEDGAGDACDGAPLDPSTAEIQHDLKYFGPIDSLRRPVQSAPSERAVPAMPELDEYPVSFDDDAAAQSPQRADLDGIETPDFEDDPSAAALDPYADARGCTSTGSGNPGSPATILLLLAGLVLGRRARRRS